MVVVSAGRGHSGQTCLTHPGQEPAGSVLTAYVPGVAKPTAPEHTGDDANKILSALAIPHDPLAFPLVDATEGTTRLDGFFEADAKRYPATGQGASYNSGRMDPAAHDHRVTEGVRCANHPHGWGTLRQPCPSVSTAEYF